MAKSRWDELARGVWMRSLAPRRAVNIYLVEDVLIDSGYAWRARDLARELRREGRPVRVHALTHAHPDHQGASRLIREEFGAEVAIGADDAPFLESGDLSGAMAPTVASRFSRWFGGPACPVDRRLREGDEVAGFRVLELPGHSPGHVAYWRERDRVLILGDVLRGMSLVTTRAELGEPPAFFSRDDARNRRSLKRLAEMRLEPSIVCFGHGPPWRDPRGFEAFLRARVGG